MKKAFLSYAEIKELENERYTDDFTRRVNAKIKPIIYMDMDGVVADFVAGYRQHFDRDAYKDDPFTIVQYVISVPNFFRTLPKLDKGIELLNTLKKDYTIVFLTTPMDEDINCRRDKIEWIRENIGPGYSIIFSSNKAEYANSQYDILIDDMEDNLKPWREAGGTAINFIQDNKKIIKKIENVIYNREEEKEIKEQVKNMEVNTDPTESQKESGLYKKGDLVLKGIKIKIENPRGGIRWGFGEDGKKWVTRMKNHYGYIAIPGAEGADGDKIDCFIGDKFRNNLAFVVNQKNPETGIFDEHKIMLGFDTIEEAEKAYRDNYKSNWQGFDSIKQTNTKKLREWLQAGNKTEPFS
jgi:5'(3')-deoxyribonucleotidase